MKIYWEWLKDYIDLDLSPKELGELLTMSGLEIEAEETVELPNGKKGDVLELNVTPNRGYCLSHIGVAREVGALLNSACRLNDPDAELEQAWGDTPVESLITVDNEAPEMCPRYSAIVIEDVAPKPSPDWLQERLIAIGLRPINNIVDITNYVMMEYGQPLHAFDHALLSGQKIVIRRARRKESFEALDGSQLELEPDALVIADAEKPVALAGIMGGTNSQVSMTTQTVVLESAFFDATVVRQGSKKYGVRSDSSYRFERKVDVDAVIKAQSRAALLIQQLAGGTICRGRVDVYPKPLEQSAFELRLARIHKVLGKEFSGAEVSSLLERMGIRATETGEGFSVEIPANRPTLGREIDLIEDIARLTGYNNFETTWPTATLVPCRRSPREEGIEAIRETLSGFGYSQAVNYSFIENDSAESFLKVIANRAGGVIPLRNPLSGELETMRTSLLPGLIKTAVRNLSKGQKPVKIFELGKVFYRDEQRQRAEKNCLGVLVVGPYENDIWKETGRSYDFYDLKGAFEQVGQRLRVSLNYQPGECDILNPARSVTVMAGDRSIGYLGELLPAQGGGIDLPVWVGELDLEALIDHSTGARKFEPIAKFPATYRDISLLVARQISSRQIQDAIQEVGSPLIHRVELYDQFEGKKLGADKKSLTYSLSFQSPERTLTEDDVTPVFQKILATLGDRFSATLREG